LPVFNFQNQDGIYVSDTDFKSELVLVTFMYSDCKTECLSVLNDLKNFETIRNEYKDELNIIIFSLDPENDTELQIKNLLMKYELHNSLDYLIGNENDLKVIWEYFYVPVANVQSKSLNRNLILHSMPAYLISDKNKFTLIYTKLDIDSISVDIKNILN
jgi:cytochrome oxidase Cu insertion factor (SCO1/SenC/PrrC family)